MPTAEAHVDTDRASRYLAQLCKHAAAIGGRRSARADDHAGAEDDVRIEAEWSETRGVLSIIPWGRCTLVADKNVLTLRVYAGDEQRLNRITDVIARNLDRFGHRDNLVVRWHRTRGPAPRRGSAS